MAKSLNNILTFDGKCLIIAARWSDTTEYISSWRKLELIILMEGEIEIFLFMQNYFDLSNLIYL